MSLELDEISIQQKLEAVVATGDKLKIQEFLDQQGISDMVDLIADNLEHESLIMNGLSLHRAVSVFKILEFSYQKRIIKELSPHKTAELLNKLPPDDRTSF